MDRTENSERKVDEEIVSSPGWDQEPPFFVVIKRLALSAFKSAFQKSSLSSSSSSTIRTVFSGTVEYIPFHLNARNRKQAGAACLSMTA
jgi:hypothetical protein